MKTVSSHAEDEVCQIGCSAVMCSRASALQT